MILTMCTFMLLMLFMTFVMSRTTEDEKELQDHEVELMKQNKLESHFRELNDVFPATRNLWDRSKEHKEV